MQQRKVGEQSDQVHQHPRRATTGKAKEHGQRAQHQLTAIHREIISWYDISVPSGAAPTDREYERLLAFRTSLRRFLRWSEDQAASVGLSAVQHQLLLAVRGHPGSADPTIGDVAEQLLLRHHSAVELVNRAEAAGLVRRQPDAHDRRVVRVHLTAEGARRLRVVTRRALDHLSQIGEGLRPVWERTA